MEFPETLCHQGGANWSLGRREAFWEWSFQRPLQELLTEGFLLSFLSLVSPLSFPSGPQKLVLGQAHSVGATKESDQETEQGCEVDETATLPWIFLWSCGESQLCILQDRNTPRLLAKSKFLFGSKLGHAIGVALPTRLLFSLTML